MKFIIAFAFLAVVSAFPQPPRFGYQNEDIYQLDRLRSEHNNHLQDNDLIIAYEQLIERLNRLSREDEDEERLVRDIIDAIIAIGQIINDNNVGDIRPPRPPHPEDDQGSNISNKPSDSATGVPPNKEGPAEVPINEADTNVAPNKPSESDSEVKPNEGTAEGPANEPENNEVPPNEPESNDRRHSGSEEDVSPRDDEVPLDDENVEVSSFMDGLGDDTEDKRSFHNHDDESVPRIA